MSFFIVSNYNFGFLIFWLTNINGGLSGVCLLHDYFAACPATNCLIFTVSPLQLLKKNLFGPDVYCLDRALSAFKGCPSKNTEG